MISLHMWYFRPTMKIMSQGKIQDCKIHKEMDKKKHQKSGATN